MNRSGPAPVAASALYLLKMSAKGTSRTVTFRSGLAEPGPATVARTLWSAWSSVPAPEEYECQIVSSPESAAGAADSGAVDPGAVDGAVDAALGAVLVPGVEQAAAMIATPATMAARRSCFFISVVVSSSRSGSANWRSGSQRLVGDVPTRSGR
jgi:hypothetical protein